MISDIPREWVSVDLPGYRDVSPNATYGRWPWAELPPVARELSPDLDWLLREPVAGDWNIASATPDDYQRMRESLSQLGPEFIVPAAFKAFVASPAAPSRIRSGTGCYLEFGQRITPTPDGGVLVHFLSDQQWVVHWWLYLGRDGSDAVVAAYPPYGFDEEPEGAGQPWDEYGVQSLELFSPSATYAALCSPSFLEFIYRYWIENEISFKLRNGTVTSEQQAYLDFYR
jgi:hypothetical protein